MDEKKGHKFILKYLGEAPKPKSDIILKYKLRVTGSDLTETIWKVDKKCKIDFGDGTPEMALNGDVVGTKHRYSEAGEYIVTIKKPSLDYSEYYMVHLSRGSKIIEVIEWNSLTWCVFMETKIQKVPDYIPETLVNTTIMFSGCREINDPNISKWNVSNIKNMSAMFGHTHKFNQPLNSWDVSNVTQVGNMFSHAEAFNQPLDKWNVSNIRDIDLMFVYTFKFDQSLLNWNVNSDVVDFPHMIFYPLSKKHVEDVIIMVERCCKKPNGVLGTYEGLKYIGTSYHPFSEEATQAALKLKARGWKLKHE